MKIGLDFGMTNSTISFYDEESKQLVNFKLGGPSANDYIPTIISYNENDHSDFCIGEIAKDNLTKKGFVNSTYENFKLSLGKSFNKVIEGKKKTPSEVTHDFIGKFLKSFEDDQKKKNSSTKIQSIVMTVPDIWLKEESNYATRENIEKIFLELGYDKDLFQLHSEPVAAAAFFRHAYKIDKGSDYSGHITVIDYGGGTLDITVCKVEGNKKEIDVLVRHGFGRDDQTKGCAGVAFDEAVIEKLIEDNNLKDSNGNKIKKDDRWFIKMRNSFEKEKKNRCDDLTIQLRKYLKDPRMVKGKELFSLEYNGDGDLVSVQCADLVHCFNKVNATFLNASLKKIQQYFDVHNIHSSEQKNFKVLLVGGFSNFYLVEAEVKKFFAPPEIKDNENPYLDYEDERFEQPFLPLNRSFAISRGAALIAQGMYIPKYYCEWNIGFIFKRLGEGDVWKDDFLTVIKIGTKIDDLQSPIFLKDYYDVTHPGGKIRFFMDDGRSDGKPRIKSAIDRTAMELFPNLNKENNKYKLGFSVNKNQIPTIHIEDKDGNPEHMPLNTLIAEIGIVRSTEGE